MGACSRAGNRIENYTTSTTTTTTILVLSLWGREKKQNKQNKSQDKFGKVVPSFLDPYPGLAQAGSLSLSLDLL